MSGNGGNGTSSGDGGQRITVSLSTLRDEIEKALLKLELSLVKTYATKADLDQVKASVDELIRHGSPEARETLKMVTSLADVITQHGTELDQLRQDKAGREAVTSFKKWLTGGALIGTLIMLIQIVISIYLVTHAHK